MYFGNIKDKCFSKGTWEIELLPNEGNISIKINKSKICKIMMKTRRNYYGNVT